MGVLVANEERYEQEVKRYKLKYRQFRCDLSLRFIEKSLDEAGCSKDELQQLLNSNSVELKTLVERLARKHPNGRGILSSVLYSSIICELLDLCGIEYDIHICFTIPTKVESKDKYNYSLVNYMYIQGKNNVKYHYFNGVIDDSNFTYLTDVTVEI